MVPELVCPVITPKPFIDDDFRAVISNSIAQGRGANSIFVLGHTGEVLNLEREVKEAAISIAVDEVAWQNGLLAKNPGDFKSVSLGVGAIAETIEETLELARYAQRVGADYLVLLPIRLLRKGEGFTRRGVTGVVEKIAQETDGMPIMIYNNPALTGGKNIRTGTFKALVKRGLTTGIKDSSGDETRLKHYREAADGRAKVYAGSEILGLKQECDGVVAGGANVFPKYWRNTTRWKQLIGENQQIATNAGLLERFQEVYAENPIGFFHIALARLGIIQDDKVWGCKNIVYPSQAERFGELIDSREFGIFSQ